VRTWSVISDYSALPGFFAAAAGKHRAYPVLHRSRDNAFGPNNHHQDDEAAEENEPAIRQPARSDFNGQVADQFRRGSNPRPKTFKQRVYMLSLVYLS